MQTSANNNLSFIELFCKALGEITRLSNFVIAKDVFLLFLQSYLQGFFLYVNIKDISSPSPVNFISI